MFYLFIFIKKLMLYKCIYLLIIIIIFAFCLLIIKSFVFMIDTHITHPKMIYMYKIHNA